MNSLFAMRRANGDWFALDDHGDFRVPVFHSRGAALAARLQDSSMECFRPAIIDEAAFANLTTTDQGNASFWLISDPLMRLSRGRALNHTELAAVLHEPEGRPV